LLALALLFMITTTAAAGLAPRGSAAPSVAGLVAAYAFDEGTGTTVSDSSGTGNTGSLSSTATWVGSGKSGAALAFNGKDSIVTVPDNETLDLTTAATFEAWVYPVAHGGAQAILAKERPGGGLPYGVETISGLPSGYVYAGAHVAAADQSTLRLNAWTHVAVTFDGSNVRLYLGGGFVASTPARGSVATSSGVLHLGGDTTWGEFFTGRLDDVRIYNRSLSPAEITADMNTPVGDVGGVSSDTTPPSAPSKVTVSSVSPTSVSLSWSPSTDNLGIAGYGVYNGTTRVSQVAGTSATVSNLSCGSSYTFGVDAYDAAGNRSAKASVAVATAACSVVGSSTVFVAPNGSDGNVCSQAAPCLSFNRAYRVAQPGGVVQVAGGSYGDQNVLFDVSKTSADDVVIQPAPGAAVSIGQLDIGANRMQGGASHLTVKDITVGEDVSIPGCGVPDNTACPPDALSPGNDLTFVNLRVKGPYAFYCASCSNVSILGGTWGPDTYQCRAGFGSAHPEVQSAYTQVKRAHGILIDGATFQNFARCTTSDHTECLQVEPADDMTVRDSIFRNCDTIGVNFANDLANSNSAAGYRAPNNILVENNFFDAAKDWTGGPTYYALNIRECSNCTVRYNSWTQAPRMPNGETHLNVKYVGNAGPFSQAGCLAGVTFSRNVWEGAACSSTDKNVADVRFVNRAGVDLHLQSTSPAIDAGDASTYPAADIDGKQRPLGAAPDAGASELR